MCRRGFAGCVSSGGSSGLLLCRRPGVGEEALFPATGIVGVPSGAINAFGAWTPLDTRAQDIYLTQLMSNRQIVTLGIVNMITEFGYGAGPTAIDVARWTWAVVDPAADDAGAAGAFFPGYLAKVPANQQLQARTLDSKAAATVFNVWASGWLNAIPTFTDLPHNGPSGAGRLYPTNISTGVITASGVAPAFGAWVDVVASAPNDLLAVSIIPSGAVAQQLSPFTAYELGIGAAGVEVVVATIPTGQMNQPCPIVPPVWVKTGERLRIRSMSNVAGTRQALVKVYDL